jgi:hypothetical protein
MGVAAIGSARGVTALTLNFNEPVSWNHASTPSLYHVFALAKHRGKHVHTKAVAIKSIEPGPAATTVIIRLARPVHGQVEVTVRGTVVATAGASIRVDYSKWV